MQKFYIPTLNGWRAISILLVIMCHALGHYVHTFPASIQNFAQKLAHAGSYGVSIFFVISGYLITSRILVEIKEFGSFNIKEFYLKRFWRIMPPFLFYLFFLVFLSVFTSLSLSLEEVVKSIFFVQVFMPQGSYTYYIGHFWSLNVEEHFYFFLSFLFLSKNLKRIVPILFATIGLLFITRYIAFHFSHNDYLADLKIWARSFLFMDYMFWGTILALLRDNEYLRKLFSVLSIGYLTQFLFCALFLLIYFNFKFKDYLLPLVAAVTVVLTTFNDKNLLGSLLESKISQFIGKISYSLYLWQQLFFGKLESEIKEISFLQNNVISYILLVAVAYGSYRFIEKPLLAFGRRSLKHKF